MVVIKKIFLSLSMLILCGSLSAMDTLKVQSSAEEVRYEQTLAEQDFKNFIHERSLHSGHTDFSDESAANLLNSLSITIQRSVAQFCDKNSRGKGYYTNTVILHGIPGTGKSCVGPAISKLTNVPCVIWNCGRIANEYKSSGPQEIHDFLQMALDSKQPYIIVLDEFEALLKKDTNKQDGDTGMMESILEKAVLLKDSPLLLIITTNSIEGIRDSLDDRSLSCEITLPNDNLRKSVVDHVNHRYQLESALIEKIYSLSDGLNLRQIPQLFESATAFAWQRYLRSNGIATPFNGKALPCTTTQKPNFADFKKARKALLNSKLNKNPWQKYFWNKAKEHGNTILGQAPLLGCTALSIYLNQCNFKQSQDLSKTQFALQMFTTYLPLALPLVTGTGGIIIGSVGGFFAGGPIGAFVGAKAGAASGLSLGASLGVKLGVTAGITKLLNSLSG